MKTTIDWLSFRCTENAFETFEILKPCFGRVSDLVSFDPGIEPKDGWTRAGQILCGGDIVLGRIDYEGESQRGWVRVVLTGEGCAWVQDWEYIAKFGIPKAQGGLFKVASIGRLDVCLTTYDGEVSHKRVKRAYSAGKFITKGRPPVMNVIESSDPRAGQTVYVGKRKSAKFCRCYDKGWELLKEVRNSETVTHIGADKVENIYRVEIEFKDKDDKFIPFDSVINRDEVFAGAYPFCAELLQRAAGRKMETLPDFKPVATMDSALENCRISYGKILRTALEAMDISEIELLQRVIAPNRSDALVRAGVLTCAHPV